MATSWSPATQTRYAGPAPYIAGGVTTMPQTGGVVSLSNITRQGVVSMPNVSVPTMPVAAQPDRTADERAFVVTSYQDRVVKLNVGGVKYESTYETLSHSALFAALLRMKSDKDEIFIDRDGVPFKWILSFLRSISVGLFSRQWAMSVMEHLPYVDKLAIMEEAEFYQIPQLMSLVKK